MIKTAHKENKIMFKDYSRKNLQNGSFSGQDLKYANFFNSDIRGADFTDADLNGADFTSVKTGITPMNTVLLFAAALVVSLLSGYVAMLAGTTVQSMLNSPETNIRHAGIVTIVIVAIFIGHSIWKGVGGAIKALVIPTLSLAVVVGLIAYFSGLGTGVGMFYLVLSILLVTIMFIVGTAARQAAGVLSSSILACAVAMGGGMFGSSLGGGVGTVVMAVSCLIITKRALKGAKGFEGLKKAATFITSKYGTSFRNAKLTDADFSDSVIKNADFTEADTTFVNWGNSKKVNCLN